VLIGICGPDVLTVLINLATAMLAAWHLHAPLAKLAGMPWAAFEGAPRRRDPFSWGQLLTAAPELLHQQLVTSAVKTAEEGQPNPP